MKTEFTEAECWWIAVMELYLTHPEVSDVMNRFYGNGRSAEQDYPEFLKLSGVGVDLVKAKMIELRLLGRA